MNEQAGSPPPVTAPGADIWGGGEPKDGRPAVPAGTFRILRFWPGAAGSPFSAPTEASEVEADALGQLAPGRDGKPALRGLGELASLVLEPLAADGKAAWDVAADGLL